MSVQYKNTLGWITAASAIALFTLQPEPFVTRAAALSAIQGTVACGFWVLACLGCGNGLFKDSAVASFGFGAGAYGLVLGILSMLFGVHLFLMTGLGALGFAAFFLRPRTRISWPPKALMVLLTVVVFAASLDAFAPPTDTDEIYQHLALPHQFLMNGTLGGGFLEPDASRPLPVHMLYTALVGLGGFAGAKLFHLVLSVLLILGLWEIAERRVGKGAGLPATLLLVGSYSFLREMGLAYNNLPAALWCLLALDQAIADKPKRMAVFSGMALAAKYTAGPAVAGIFLAWWIQKGLRALPQVLGWSALALCFVAPWWIHNLTEGLHPLFPYAGWASPSTQFMLLEKYGMGRSLTDFLALPWNLTVHANPESFVFLGRVNPAGLLLLPAGLLLAAPKHRGIWIAATVAFIGWAVGPHWLRYLLPAAPILALALSGGFLCLPRWTQWFVGVGFVLGIPANTAPWASRLAEASPAALGHQSEKDQFEQSIPGWKAVEWINQNTPTHEPVALLFAWPKALIERPVLLGSVEDHVPTRVHLERHASDALANLKKRGVNYVLVGGACEGCKNFLKKSYPFLSHADFQEQYRSPVLQLRGLLTKEGAKVFESGKYSVWRLL